MSEKASELLSLYFGAVEDIAENGATEYRNERLERLTDEVRQFLKARECNPCRTESASPPC